MSCAYGAGVAWALQDAGIRPDMFVGSSGSAGTVSYFACGRAPDAARLWVEQVTSSRVIQRNPLRLDVDFIIDSMRDKFPLDPHVLRNESIELYLAATDYRTIRPHFFSNRDPLDWYEVMRASMAIPFVYGAQVQLNGEWYFDGDIATTLADCVRFAKQKGAQRIYVCDTSYTPYLQSALEIGIRPLLSKDFLKAAIGLGRRMMSADFEDAKVIDFKPSRELKVHSLDNSREAIEEAVQAGYAETSARFQSA